MKRCLTLSTSIASLAFNLSISSTYIATVAEESTYNTKDGKNKNVFSTEMSWTVVTLIYSLVEYRRYLIARRAKEQPSKSSFRLFIKRLFSWSDDDKSLISPAISTTKAKRRRLDQLHHIPFRAHLLALPYIMVLLAAQKGLHKQTLLSMAR